MKKQVFHQEGSPDYWGIETIFVVVLFAFLRSIRKDHPTTGVLKPATYEAFFGLNADYQEGSPDYWGIETNLKNVCGIEPDNLSGRITRLLGY